jgi:hypothetical protein
MPPALAGLLGEVPQVGDDVVARLALDLGDAREVEPRRGFAQRRELGVRDRQPELGLALGEQDPQPPPGRVAVAGGKDRRHRAEA